MKFITIRYKQQKREKGETPQRTLIWLKIHILGNYLIYFLEHQKK